MGFYNMTHLPNSQVVWTPRRGALIYASVVNAYCDGRSERIEFCHEYPSGALVLFLPLVETPKGESMTEIAFGTPPLPTATPSRTSEPQPFPYELLTFQEVMSGIPHELRDEALHPSDSPAELKD